MNPKDCMRSKEEMKLLADIAELEAENRRLREALAFYSEGQHLIGFDEWDTVSGEGENWYFPQYDQSTLPRDLDFPEAVENGGAAREALNHGIKKDGG